MKATKFLQEVKQEATKVSWPTRQEVLVSGAVVAGAVLICSLIFLFIDSMSYRLVQLILNINW